MIDMLDVTDTAGKVSASLLQTEINCLIHLLMLISRCVVLLIVGSGMLVRRRVPKRGRRSYRNFSTGREARGVGRLSKYRQLSSTTGERESVAKREALLRGAVSLLQVRRRAGRNEAFEETLLAERTDETR